MTAIGIVIVLLAVIGVEYSHAKWMEPDGSEKWCTAEARFQDLMMVGFGLIAAGLLTWVWRYLP